MSKRVVGTVVCSIEDLPATLTGLLGEYNTWLVDQSRLAVEDATKDARKETKGTRPYNDITGKYRQSISYKMDNGINWSTGLVYSDSGQHRLTHLLENGHKLWNRPSRPTRQFKHWLMGEAKAQEVLPKYLKERLGES